MRIRSPEIYMDLGTANTLVYVKGQGFVLNEPSYISYKHGPLGREIMAVGSAAKKMLGRAPENVEVLRPLREGVIADFEASQQMLAKWFEDLMKGGLGLRPRVLLSLPCQVTETEKKAMIELGLSMGASDVDLLEEPMAAAIGENLSISSPEGIFVVDIGGGTTEIALIALNGIVFAKTLRFGGHHMDARIVEYLRNKYNFVVGEAQAEELKIQFANADIDKTSRFDVKGLDLVRGLPSRLSIMAQDLHDALESTLRLIIEGIREAMAEVPVEFSGDLLSQGLLLTGGASLIRNLPERVEREIGIPVKRSTEPLLSVARGGSKVLEEADTFEAAIMNNRSVNLS
jgi:rod shape-determining protein MreB